MLLRSRSSFTHDSASASRDDAPVIEKQLLARLDRSFGEDAYPVIAVHHHHFRVTVGIYRVIGESDFIPLPRRVDNEVCKQRTSKVSMNRRSSRRINS